VNDYKKAQAFMAAQSFFKALSRMTLKTRVLLPDSGEGFELSTDLAKATRKKKCLYHAMFLMIVLVMLSVAGLGYCAVLQPDVFQEPNHPLTYSLSVLALGSLLAQGVFLACLLWQRATIRRLQAKCQRLVLAHSCLPGPTDPGLERYGQTKQ
jgi:hypothetical protein